MKKLLVMIAVLALTGCASITKPHTQAVSLQTMMGNQVVAGAGCTLANDEGQWSVVTPGSVTVHKSTAALTINCNKGSHFAGQAKVDSKANRGAWGNIIAGGMVGYIADRNTGAGFDYPNSITVMLNKIGEAEMSVSPVVVPASQSTATTVQPPAALATLPSLNH